MLTCLVTISIIETEVRRGGSVGLPIKDCIIYKMRNNIISLDYSLEHLWIEVRSKNKISPVWFELSTKLATKMLRK